MPDLAFHYWKRVDDLRGSITLTEMCKAIGLNEKTIMNMRSQNRLPKQQASSLIASFLNTTVDFLMTGIKVTGICEEAQYVQNNPEARTIVRLMMADPSILPHISALVMAGRKEAISTGEKEA